MKDFRASARSAASAMRQAPIALRRAFQRVGGLAPLAVGTRRFDAPQIDWGLGAEEIQDFPLELAIAEGLAREMGAIERERRRFARLQAPLHCHAWWP